MSIQIHKWSEKSGTCVIEQNGKEFELALYAYGTSNCYLVAFYIWHDPDDEPDMINTQMQWFFMDESHAKIMLGLKKGGDGKKENYMDEVRKITLYKNKCTEWKKIMTMFAEAFDKIEIQIRSDAE